MHMADALLSAPVGTAMCVVSAAAISYSVKQIKKDDLCEKKIPVMGVMGAFVFAAQMINFTIPATGSSGHISGGILLAAMLGGYPALLAISAVLIIQCLFFADGGLLALGCNIFNMGVIPCLIVYPLLFQPFIKKGITLGKITIVSIAAVVVGLQLGSFGVVLETQFSGITQLPFLTFTVLMQPIHLAIGLIEGIVTSAILCFVYKMRPEIMESAVGRISIKKGVPMGKILILLAVITLFVGGGLSLYASSNPDGLEWAIEKTASAKELESMDSVSKNAESLQEESAIMPDYDYKDTSEDGSGAGTSTAGIIGGIITFLLAGVSAFIIHLFKKANNDSKTRGDYS